MTAAIKISEQRSAAGLEKWARRRTWSRTDSTRWLDARSALALAILRRRTGRWPDHARQLGLWLREHDVALFDRVHTRLTRATDSSREQINLIHLLR